MIQFIVNFHPVSSHWRQEPYFWLNKSKTLLLYQADGTQQVDQFTCCQVASLWLYLKRFVFIRDPQPAALDQFSPLSIFSLCFSEIFIRMQHALKHFISNQYMLMCVLRLEHVLMLSCLYFRLEWTLN